MNRNTTVSLIKEFKAAVKNQALSDMLVVKANDYMQKGLNESEVFSAVLNDIKGVNESLNSSSVVALIENFAKFEKSPVLTVQSMMKECGLAKSLKAIKESAAFTDPVIRTTIIKIEESLNKVPEFRFIPNFIEVLKPFSYEPTIKNAIVESAEFMQKNATKLLVLNSIFEMRIIPSNMYQQITSVLEKALIDDNYSAKTLSVLLREQVEIPVVKNLINNLSNVEGKATKVFNAGLGNSKVMVESVIAPTTRIEGQNAALVLLNKFLFTITESDVQFATEETAMNEDFRTFCSNFVQLDFKPTKNGIKAGSLRNIELEMKNEGEDLNLYLNKKQIKTSGDINYSEVFVLENSNSRQFLSSVFENLNFMNSLDFIKLFVAEKKSVYVINLNESHFVVENTNTPTITKMNNVQLCKYLKENFDYDLTPQFEDDLTDHDNEVNAIEDEQDRLLNDIDKLEGSVKTLDDSLSKNLDEEDSSKVVDLKFVIEKQINAMKDKIVLLEAKKKKLFETNSILPGKNHRINETVRLKDGRTGTVTGVDTHAGRYMVRTEDGKISPFRSHDIE